MSKKRKHATNGASTRGAKKQKQSSSSSAAAGKHGASKPSQKHQRQQQQQRQRQRQHQQNLPELNPFPAGSHVLLVGEGDLSFAHLLATSPRRLRPRHITATTYDPLESVLQKYPSTVPEYVAALSALSPSTAPTPSPTVTLHHGIDGARLASYKPIKTQRYDVIAFLFPHIGGKSTDQNRQIRGNQLLLKGFFAAAKGLLKEGGRVVVSLFEGKVYEEWDARGLARAEGLVGVVGGKFDTGLWEGKEKGKADGAEKKKEEVGKDEEEGEAEGDEDKEEGDDGKDGEKEKEKDEKKEPKQPVKRGYRHVRTLGEIAGGGAWRGEERKARWYVFCKRGEVKSASAAMGIGKNGKKRKKRGSDDDDSDEGNSDGDADEWGDEDDADKPWSDNETNEQR